MNILLKTLCLTACLFISFSPSQGQDTVWPGDVNNNGIVNGLDLLFLGLAFDSTGAVRPDGTTDWIGQDAAPDWDYDFPNGINWSFADCDGDGHVDQQDIIKGIKDNFGLTHGDVTPDNFSTGEAGSDPQLRLLTDNNFFLEGASVDFQLNMGSAEHPVEDLHGFAFTLKYDKDLINGENVEFEISPGTWMDPEDESRIKTLTRVDDDNGLVHIAVTRTRPMTTSGFGEIGHFIIVIEDIIVGLEQEDVVTSVEIDSVWVVNDQMSLQPIVKDTFKLTITEDLSDTINNITHLTNFNIEIYPNPTQDWVQINTSNTSIEQIELWDWTGRPTALFESNQSHQHTIHLQDLAEGIYLLVVTTPFEKQSQRLVVQRE